MIQSIHGQFVTALFHFIQKVFHGFIGRPGIHGHTQSVQDEEQKKWERSDRSVPGTGSLWVPGLGCQRIFDRTEIQNNAKFSLRNFGAPRSHPWINLKFYNLGFPLEKAIQYEKLRKPFVINDLEKQWDIQGQIRSIFVRSFRFAIANRDTIMISVHDRSCVIRSSRTFQRQSESLSDTQR